MVYSSSFLKVFGDVEMVLTGMGACWPEIQTHPCFGRMRIRGATKTLHFAWEKYDIKNRKPMGGFKRKMPKNPKPWRLTSNRNSNAGPGAQKKGQDDLVTHTSRAKGVKWHYFKTAEKAWRSPNSSPKWSTFLTIRAIIHRRSAIFPSVYPKNPMR